MNEAEQLPKIKCLFGSSLNSLIADGEERQRELNPPFAHRNGDSLSKVFSYLMENGIFNENKTKQKDLAHKYIGESRLFQVFF